MIDDLLADAKDRMKKTVESTSGEFATVRTGRATPHLLDRISVDYYGANTPLNQLANVAASEARLLTVTPYDKGALGLIEKAIQESDVGLTPSNDGNVIRVAIPQLTEDRRKDLVKQAKGKGEDAKVSIRNIRRKAMEELARIKKDGDAGEDDVARAEKDLDKSTHTYTAQVDDLVKHKEGELLEV